MFTFPYCIVAFPESPQERKCVSNNATVTINVGTSPAPQTPTPNAPATPPASQGPSLPQTGAPVWTAAVIGLVLLALGVAALVVTRRRRA